jgi:Uma2 family endonuclease
MWAMAMVSGSAPLIDRDEFRRMEAASPSGVRLERMDGYVYAMAGASLAHERVVTRLIAILDPAARARGGEVLGSNRRLSIGPDTDFLPDVSVYCDPDDDDDYAGTRPCLVVEVLSRSTALDDLNLKVPRYQKVPSIETILLVNPDPLYAEVFTRTDAGWDHAHVADVDAAITLACPGISFTLGALAS